MGTPSSTKSWWQYARWVWVISRTMRIQLPSNAEYAVLKTFIKFFWNAKTRTGTRPWLATPFDENSIKPQGGSPGDPDVETVYVNIKNLGVIARNLDEIPMTDVEASQIDILIANTGTRRYGASPLYGNLI